MDNSVRGFLIFMLMSRLSELPITIDEVYDMTNMGLDIFQKEIEDFSIVRNVRNPFINEKNPSARIKQSRKSGIWLLNIYNDEGGFYTPISFIQKKYNLNFNQAIEYITKDIEIEPISKITIKESKKPTFYYDFEAMPYTQKHKDYYCCELDENFLVGEMDIMALKRYAINKHIKYPKKDEIMFVYEHKDITAKPTNRLKLLTIGKNVEKKDKWRTNCIPFEFFYTYKIVNGDLVFVCKSNKDAAITQKLGITSLATMSENKSNIACGLYNIMQQFPKCQFVLNLGTDIQGKNTSIALSKEFGLKWFNTENRFLSNGINDNFSFVQQFGISALKKQLTKKGFL